MSALASHLSAPLSRLRRFRLRLLRHRRALAALAVGLATWFGVQAAMAPPSPTEPVWTLARDLSGGAVLAAADLERTDFLAGTVPPTAVTDPSAVVGRPLAHSVARGQPLSESMVLGQRWVEEQGATVIPVRISDPDVVQLLRVGDRVDLYGTDVSGASEAPDPTGPLAASVRVAAIPRAPAERGSEALPGRLVLLAVPESRVESVTSAAARQFLSVAWSR